LRDELITLLNKRFKGFVNKASGGGSEDWLDFGAPATW